MSLDSNSESRRVLGLFASAIQHYKYSIPCDRTVLSASACVAAPSRCDLLPAASESPSTAAMPSLLLSEPHLAEEIKISKKMKSENFKKRKVAEDEEESDTTSDSTVVKRPKLMEEGEEADDPNALSNFRISNALREALESKGIKALFPIQAMTFDFILDGFDLVGRARTGQVGDVLPLLITGRFIVSVYSTTLNCVACHQL